MDSHQFQIPRAEPPPLRATATQFIDGINAQMVWVQHHKKAEEVVRIFYGGAFGVYRAIRISPEGNDFLRIVVKDEDGLGHVIVAPVSQCSFMLSLIVPEADAEPEEKVILGFAEGERT